MPIENPQFAEAGAQAGDARGWRLVARVSTTAVAMFSRLGWETFAWHTPVRELVPGGVIVAVFDGARAETFDGWALGAAASLTEASISTALWSGGASSERFGDGPLVGTWPALAQAVAGFGDGAREAFVAGWPGTSGHASAWNAALALPAVFGGDLREDFTSGWPLV